MPHHRLVLAAVVALVNAVPAHALDIQFTFQGVAPPAGSSLFGRIWEPGDLVGVLHGLLAEGDGQLPTAVTFVSGYAPVGLSQLRFEATEWAASGGLDVHAGALIGSSRLQLNLADPVLGGRVLTFNVPVFGPPTSYNALAWNGGPPSGVDDGRRPGVGNGLGFDGATYAALAPVPEPAPLALWAAGAALLAGFSRSAARRPGAQG